MPGTAFGYRYAIECELGSAFPPDPANGYAAWMDAAVGVFSDAAGTIPAANGGDIQCWRSAGGSYGLLENKAVGGFGVPSWISASPTFNNQPAVQSVAADFELLRQFPIDANIFKGGILNVSQGTVFAVVARNPVGVPAACAWGDDAGYVASCYHTPAGTPLGRSFVFDGASKVADFNAPAPTTGVHLLCFHLESGVLYSGVDEVRTAFMTGTACGNIDAGVAALVVCGSTGPGQYLDGLVGSIIFYPAALAEGPRRTTGRYLAGRFAIPITF